MVIKPVLLKGEKDINLYYVDSPAKETRKYR